MSVRQLLSPNLYNLFINNLTLSGTQDSTSTSTGAFKILGGVGIAKNENIGGWMSSDNMRSIESFGAVGDGLTDDSTAINAALASGKNILFGFQKTYKTVATLTLPTTGSRIIDFNNSTITNNDNVIMTITGQTSGLRYILKNGTFTQTKNTAGCLSINTCAGKLYFQNMRLLGPAAASGYGSATIIYSEEDLNCVYFDSCYVTSTLLAFRDVADGTKQADTVQFDGTVFDCSVLGVGAITTELPSAKHYIIDNSYFKCANTNQYAIYAYMEDLRSTNTVYDWINSTDGNSLKLCGCISPKIGNYYFENCYIARGLWATCPNTNAPASTDIYTSNVWANQCDLYSTRMSVYTTVNQQPVRMHINNCKMDRFVGADIYVVGTFTPDSLYEVSNCTFTNQFTVTNSGTIYTGVTSIHDNIFRGINANGSLYMYDFVDGIMNICNNSFQAPADGSMLYLIKTRHRPTISTAIPATFRMNIDGNIATDSSRILHGLESHWSKPVNGLTLSNNKGSGKLFYCTSNTSAAAVTNSWAFNNITRHTNNLQTEIIAWNGSNAQCRGYGNVNIVDASNDPVHISIMKLGNTANSTSVSTGSLQVLGGVGISSRLTVGSWARVLSTTTATSTSTGALVVSGGVGIGDALYPTSLYLPTTGGTASNLNYYEETADGVYALGGAVTDQNLTVQYTKIGRIVMLSWNSFTHAASGVAAAMYTGAGSVPARFRPGEDVWGYANVTDNSVTNMVGSIRVQTDGTILIYNGTGTGNFSTTNNVGINRCSISYLI